jgi:hypothetical protein
MVLGTHQRQFDNNCRPYGGDGLAVGKYVVGQIQNDLTGDTLRRINLSQHLQVDLDLGAVSEAAHKPREGGISNRSPDSEQASDSEWSLVFGRKKVCFASDDQDRLLVEKVSRTKVLRQVPLEGIKLLISGILAVQRSVVTPEGKFFKFQG